MMTQPDQHRDPDVGLLPTTTMVLWMGCIVVGTLGLVLPYPWPHAPAKEPPPVVATLMNVELTKNPLPPLDIGAPSPPAESALPAPPAMPDAPAAPPAPPLVAVATPSPAIAFPLPVEGPSRIVDAKEAVPAPPAPIAPTQPSAQPTAAAPSGPQRLTYGQGEGRQPAPEYPREAALAHQEGTVVVRFTVGEDGRVRMAQAISPSPYPLLNQAAVRAVRETWRFRPGPPRTYEVSIEFQLRQR